MAQFHFRIGDIINNNRTIAGIGLRKVELPPDHHDYIDPEEYVPDDDGCYKGCPDNCNFTEDGGTKCPGYISYTDTGIPLECPYTSPDEELVLKESITSIKRVIKMEIKSDGSIFIGKPVEIYDKERTHPDKE